MTRDLADLDAALDAARDADPGTRIELRDAIAAHGEDAIDAMTDWLGDPRLAAFALRVLARISRDEASREAVVAHLRAVDRDELDPPVIRDLDATLASLGATRGRPAARSTGSGTGGRTAAQARTVGLPGAAGRKYWVMRTSPWQRSFIWAEAQRGCLRQGWGWDESQNLDVIAEAVRRGVELNEEQLLARRARRMRSAERGGVRLGDVVVAPNLPEWGYLSVFRVAGSYTWDPVDSGVQDRFGHVLPVELLAQRVNRRSPVVSDALRAMLRPQTRLYSIDNVGGDVEQVIEASAGI